jgi:hypothetical protein
MDVDPQVVDLTNSNGADGKNSSPCGQGALEAAKNILRTLQDVVQISCNVTAKHRQRTFGM